MALNSNIGHNADESGSSSSEDEDYESYIQELVEKARSNLIPEQSKHLYEAQYKKFQEWRAKMKLRENLKQEYLLAYFEELSQTYVATTLWATYSKLKATINLKENLDISKYHELQCFLKRKAKEHIPKKAMVFTTEDINRFLSDAPDQKHLLHKVVLVIGLHRCLRTIELLRMKLIDITEHGDVYLIQIPNTKTKVPKSFMTSPEVHQIINKYMKLRPHGMERFFVQYRNEKCTRQNVGKRKISDIPKDIARFLKLEHAEKYTGHALRRSSATLAADLGADLITLKRLGKWRSSTVAEGYIDDSKLCKKNNSKLIASALDIKKPCTAVASGDCIKKYDINQRSTSSRKLPGEILPGEMLSDDIEEICSISQMEYNEVLETQFHSEDDRVQQPKNNAKPLRKPLLPQNNNIVISQHKLSDNELKDCQLTLDDYNDFVMQEFEVPEHANGIKKFNPNSSDKSNVQYNNRNEKENPVYIFKNCNVTINNK